MLKFFKNIPLGLTYILPLALLTGPAIPDIIIVTISLWFLISSFYKKDYHWIKLPIVKIFFLFWFSLILISFFSYNKFFSFTDSIIFIRFLFLQ